MGKRKKNKGGYGDGAWVKSDLFLSRAYHALTGFAPQLLILFLGKRNFQKIKKNEYVCLNCDALTMTFAELENLYNLGSHNKNLPKDGITKTRANAAFKQLMAKGFIKIVRHGGAYQRDKNIYALTDDWRWWQPGEVIYERPEDTRKRGYRNPKKK